MENYQTRKSGQRNRMSTVLMLLCMILCAIPYGFMGMLTPEIMAAFHISAGETGNMSFLLNFGGIISLIVGMLVADRIPKQWSIFFLGTLMASSLIIILKCSSYAMLLAMIFLFGISSNLINANISAYMGDIHPQKRTQYTNLVAAFYSGGAIVAPLYSSWMSEHGTSFRQIYCGPGIIIAIIMLLFIPYLSDIHDSETLTVETRCSTKGAITTMITAIRTPVIRYAALISFFCSITQNGFSFWYPTYLASSSPWSDRLVSIAATVYWSMEFLGRLIYSFCADKVDARRYIFLGSIAGVLGTGCTLAFGGSPGLFVGLVVMGLANSAIYPVTIALACQHSLELSGTAASFVCLMASVGGLVSGKLIGVAADHMGIGIAIWLVVIGCGLNSVFAKQWLSSVI